MGRVATTAAIKPGLGDPRRRRPNPSVPQSSVQGWGCASRQGAATGRGQPFRVQVDPGGVGQRRAFIGRRQRYARVARVAARRCPRDSLTFTQLRRKRHAMDQFVASIGSRPCRIAEVDSSNTTFGSLSRMRARAMRLLLTLRQHLGPVPDLLGRMTRCGSATVTRARWISPASDASVAARARVRRRGRRSPSRMSRRLGQEHRPSAATGSAHRRWRDAGRA